MVCTAPLWIRIQLDYTFLWDKVASHVQYLLGSTNQQGKVLESLCLYSNNLQDRCNTHRLACGSCMFLANKGLVWLYQRGSDAQ